MANPSRKTIARSLRDSGNPEAALAVLLDFVAAPNGADDDAQAATKEAKGPALLTTAEMRQMSEKRMSAAMADPAQKAVFDASIAAEYAAAKGA